MASPPEPFRRVYRIVSSQYRPLDASGTYRWGSRWVSPGRWVIHAAETYALAVLENLVHWQNGTLPPTQVYVEIQMPHDVTQSRFEAVDVPGWDRSDYAASREAGDGWYDAGETAVLWVPSAMSPYESNVLLNPQHADFHRLRVSEPATASMDPRL
jgi:RES domain-containing protein